MRLLLPAAAIVLLLTLPGALAGQCRSGQCGGNGAGVEVAGFTTGTWDIWRVQVNAAGTLASSLTWVSSPGGADYDMTLWKPGADLDGILSSSEILKTSWTKATTPGEAITFPVTPNPPGQRYVLTVEPVTAKLETYTINATGGTLIGTCHGAAYQASAGALCMPAATGSTKFR